MFQYKSRDLMQESMRFCHVMHSMKRIEIFLSHIKDKNKFKNKNSLFHLVQCFKTIFVTFFIQYFKTTISFIWFDVSRFFFSLTHKKLFAFLFTHFTSTPLYTHAHNNLLSISSQIHRQKLQPFKDTYITSTLWYHLILTHVSRL